MRKKALLVHVFVFVLCISSSAQNSPVDKGSWFISGNFTFSSAGGDLYENSDGDRLTTIEFTPAANFFVGPGFSIGGRLLFESLSRGNSGITTWGVGPEINYFFSSSEEKSEAKGSTYPFLQAGFFYTNISYDSDRSQTGTKIRLGGGITHMISNTAAIAGLAAYDIDSEKPEEGDSESGNQFGVYAGLIIFLY